MSNHKVLVSLLATAVLAACGGSDVPSEVSADTSTAAVPAVAAVDTGRIMNAAEEPEMWLTYGGSYDETRHSSLASVNGDTIQDLGVSWVYTMDKPRGAEATPIVVDGVMYVSGSWSVVYAIDAKTGEELWTYDPEVSGKDAAKGCCDVVNRGVAVHNGKVFVGVFDGRLEALDAATGEVLWSNVTVDQSKPYTITGAPRVFKDKVIIGNSGAELGVRGYVTAYNVETGEEAWRFYTVPNPNKEPDGAASDTIFAELANDSWGDTGAWTTDGGGGTVWDSIVYDTVNDQVLIGVGNGSPWNASVRDPEGDFSGAYDNLFLSSILAVDADTGAYRWHYQTTPRDQWDYTATQQMILAELPMGEDGAMRRVVMQAPKNGFFYVLDAADGELLSAIPFAEQNWTTGEVDENGRPVILQEAIDLDNYVVYPGPTGGHNWHPMSFNPDTGLVYIPTNVQLPMVYAQNENAENANSHWNIGYDYAAGWAFEFPEGTLEFTKTLDGGTLVAWDPVKGEPAWMVPFPQAFNGGTLSTDGGLVFQGNKAGEFVAYDATNGSRVWSSKLSGDASAAPMTYEIDGEQYVSVLSGWGSTSNLIYGVALDKPVSAEPGRVITFKLGGTAEMPNPLEYNVVETPKAALAGDAGSWQLGMQRFAENCMFCHGAYAIGSGVLPDLRWSAMAATEQSWQAIVRDGALTDSGMIAFGDRLSNEEIEAIRTYVLRQAWLAVENGHAEAPDLAAAGDQ
jgi:quinohemoprotein ethanol dehydrogenase